MIKDLNKILVEWSYRTSDGKPDVKNRAKLLILENVLNDFGWSREARAELLGSLMEAPKQKGDKIDPDTIVKYKDKDGEDKEAKYSYASRAKEGTPAKIAADKLKGSDGDKKDGEKLDEPSEFDRDVDSNKGVSPDFKRPTGDDGEEKEDGKRVINGKDKSIKQVNTSETETFSNDIEPDDDNFSNDLEIGEPPPKFELPEELNKGKFPKKYAKLISRMMNSKRVGTKPEISTLISSGGAGAISAQAGEVLTLMATSMSDKEWESLQNSMLDHEKAVIKNNEDLKAPGKRVINKSWIVASGKSRKAIRDRISKKYGEGVEIINTGWDTEEDVSALGWDDYAGQKGFSTDMYVKVKTKDGQEIMDEVSLKKDVKINFLNSSTGKFREWDNETDGTDIDSKVYAGNERKSLNKAIQEFGLDLPEPKSRKSAKTVWMSMVSKTNYDTKTGKMTLSNPPTKEELWVQSHVKQIRNYTTNSTRAIVENPKLKAGMLKSIRKEFPLKSVGEGEETMAIGDLSLDPDTMKELFGTSDFEKIKENLVVNEDVNPPALAYRAETGDDVFNVASIVIRQDGVGYGGSSMKFEMQMDKEFANKLRESHNKVYG